MKKLTLILIIIIFIAPLISGQDIKEIISFSYTIVFNDVSWYKITAKVKDNNDSIFLIYDSLMTTDPKVEKTFPYSDEIVNDIYVGKRCYNKNDVQRCIIDSVHIYLPFDDTTLGSNMSFSSDKFSMLNFSFLLQEANEPKIYQKDYQNEIVRFIMILSNTVKIYRIENNNGQFILIKKTLFIDNQDVKILKGNALYLSKNEFDKIIKLLKKGKYWQIDKNNIIELPNILIESNLDGDYYFICKNETEIKLFNRRLLKCFKFLDNIHSGPK